MAAIRSIASAGASPGNGADERRSRVSQRASSGRDGSAGGSVAAVVSSLGPEASP